MTIVAVAAILGALAVPMLRPNHVEQLRAAARLLAADLDAARIGSLTRSDDPLVLVLAADGSGYHVAAQSDPTTPIAHPVSAGQTYALVFGAGEAAAYSSVSISANSVGGDDRLAFTGFGATDQGTDATITLSAGGRSITLTVNAGSGEVTISAIS